MQTKYRTPQRQIKNRVPRSVTDDTQIICLFIRLILQLPPTQISRWTGTPCVNAYNKKKLTNELDVHVRLYFFYNIIQCSVYEVVSPYENGET